MAPSETPRAEASVTSLASVQRLLYELLTAPAGVRSGLAARGLDAAMLDGLVVGDERLPAIERLDLYANMYFHRILDVLREEYPRVLVALGDDVFHDLVTDYLLAEPPAHPSLREVGARLPRYLAAGHGSVEGRAWVADLARLERAHRELFDGPDAAPLMMSTLRALAPEDFVSFSVRLIPCHVVLNVSHALASIWAPSGAGYVTPASMPETLLVWRDGLTVRHRVLDDPAERALLIVAAQGASFGGLCEALAVSDALGAPAAGDDGEAALAARAFQIFARWVDDGLLTTGDDGRSGDTAR